LLGFGERYFFQILSDLFEALMFLHSCRLPFPNFYMEFVLGPFCNHPLCGCSLVFTVFSPNSISFCLLRVCSGDCLRVASRWLDPVLAISLRVYAMPQFNGATVALVSLSAVTCCRFRVVLLREWPTVITDGFV
jgi:hypothetical protein